MPFKLGGGNKLEYYDPKTGRYCSSPVLNNAEIKFSVGKKDFKSVNMPYYRKAITDESKFLHYSLDSTNPNNRGKAEAYEKALGYNLKNYKSLINQVHRKIFSGNAKMNKITVSQHGTKYEFTIPIKGINGAVKDVIVVYIIDKNAKYPRLVTNYVKGK